MRRKTKVSFYSLLTFSYQSARIHILGLFDWQPQCLHQVRGSMMMPLIKLEMLFTALL